MESRIYYKFRDVNDAELLKRIPDGDPDVIIAINDRTWSKLVWLIRKDKEPLPPGVTDIQQLAQSVIDDIVLHPRRGDNGEGICFTFTYLRLRIKRIHDRFKEEAPPNWMISLDSGITDKDGDNNPLEVAASKETQPEEVIIARQLRQDVASAIQRLRNDKQRITAWLTLMENMQTAEIALLLELPDNQVRQLLYRARCQLRIYLAAYDPRRGPVM